MLTARGEPEDRVRGLEIGVDDYLSKPFDPRELLLRSARSCAARGRSRSASPRPSVVRFGPFLLSLERGELRAGDELVRITEREREMLRLLCANPGSSVARGAAGSGGAAQERTVDVLINRLRRKIERDPANPVSSPDGARHRLSPDRRRMSAKPSFRTLRILAAGPRALAARRRAASRRFCRRDSTSARC